MPGIQYASQTLNEKQHTWPHKQRVVREAICVAFIKTLPRILRTGAIIIRVRFLDLFEPITGVTNPIMLSLLRRIVAYIAMFKFAHDLAKINK